MSEKKPTEARFDELCACTHGRYEHADMDQRCDSCECKAYNGHVAPLPPPSYESLMALYEMQDMYSDASA